MECKVKKAKTLIITYTNGDRETSILNINSNEMIQNIIDASFKSAWFSKDENGNYTNVTNMSHVRSIEILDIDQEDLNEG